MRVFIIFGLFLPFFVNCMYPFRETKPAWWVNGVFYQIYPLSYQDSDGDGYGDLRGITNRISYLKSIGVTAVWLSPIFQSPRKDNGYDISDYYSIDEIYGTMEDFDNLKKALDKNGIKLMLDLVPNHTSDQHPWFQKSIAREGDYEDYYIWAKPKSYVDGKPVPPNNWVDFMGKGSAWEWNAQRQEFYLHNFLIFQPELNYRNLKVVNEIANIMEFWFNKGVDGFRVDAVPYIFKDKELRDEPLIDPKGPWLWENMDHIYTQNQPEIFNLIDAMADFVNKFNEKDSRNRVIFLEAHVDIKHKVKYYGGFKVKKTPQFIMPFNFLLEVQIDRKSTAETFKDIIVNWMKYLPQDGVTTWVIGNHDVTRVATKMGENFVDAMNMISLTLPGVSVVYYGEEIGMHDTFVPYELCQDNFGKVLGPEKFEKGSRDFFRTPMQWDTSLCAGFSTNPRTWLPLNSNYWKLNVKYQTHAVTSHLKVFRTMVQTKKTKTLAFGDLEVLAPDTYTLIIKRSLLNSPTYVLIVNVGPYMSTHNVADYGAEGRTRVDVVIASRHCQHSKGEKLVEPKFPVTLRPRAAVLVKISKRLDFIRRSLVWQKNLMLRFAGKHTD